MSRNDSLLLTAVSGEESCVTNAGREILLTLFKWNSISTWLFLSGPPLCFLTLLVAVAVFLLNSTVGLLTKELSTGFPFSSSAKLILQNRRKEFVIFVHENIIMLCLYTVNEGWSPTRENTEQTNLSLTHFFFWSRDDEPPKSRPPNKCHTTDISFSV